MEVYEKRVRVLCSGLVGHKTRPTNPLQWRGRAGAFEVCWSGGGIIHGWAEWRVGGGNAERCSTGRYDIIISCICCL